MLSRVSERKMLSVRSVLFGCWLVLIASLLWDPLTPLFTQPANVWSPFHIHTSSMVVAGVTVDVVPYHMTNRFFWTMLVPLLPLFLMVFGHEAWRRICPLSFASQIPRYLGLQRLKASNEQRTGAPQRSPVVIARNSWLHRNAWYVQFGLLYIGLSARLLFSNSDRIALFVSLLVVITAAMLVGSLWGGKTWCNYICPVNVVQRIYTEPRGVLESAPHFGKQRIPQSMCRTSGTGGEKSACVRCHVACGDIDLERSYWETIGEPSRRHVYYMFFGLVCGFYGFYYLYAGSWDYYFTGIWTHEANQVAAVLKPGLLIDGYTIPLPKLIAAPLVLALFSAAALGLGALAEACYRRFRRARRAISEAELVNHCLAVSAFISINTFYIFGGRPNLLLMPMWLMVTIDIIIVALSTAWLWGALQRSPFKYKRESLASSMLAQIRNMNIDVSKYLEGRSLEDLKPDEVYILGKVLPDFSHEDKLSAYRNVLEDAINTGKTNSRQFIQVLNEMRSTMGVSEKEHTGLLESLGARSENPLPQVSDLALEKSAYSTNYREVVGTAIATQVEQGQSIEAAVRMAHIQSTISVLRSSFQISDGEHDEMLHGLSGEGSILHGRISRYLDELRQLQGAKFCVAGINATDRTMATLQAIIAKSIEQRVQAIYAKLFAVFSALGNTQDVRWYAASLVKLGGSAVGAAISSPCSLGAATWHDRLDPELIKLLYGEYPAADVLTDAPIWVTPVSYLGVIRSGLDLGQNLAIIVRSDDAVLTAVALTLFAQVDLQLTRNVVETVVLMNHDVGQWLLLEVLDQIFLSSKEDHANSMHDLALRVTVLRPDAPPQVTRFTKPFVVIGRATGNDIRIDHPAVLPQHLTVSRDPDGVNLLRFGKEPIHINGQQWQGDSCVVPSCTHIEFSSPDSTAPSIRVELSGDGKSYDIQRSDTITKLAWFAGEVMFQSFDLLTLADIAASAEVRRYPKGTALCQAGDVADELFFIRHGVCEVGSDNLAAAGPDPTVYPATATVTSDFAIVVVIQIGEELAAIGRPFANPVYLVPTGDIEEDTDLAEMAGAPTEQSLLTKPLQLHAMRISA